MYDQLNIALVDKVVWSFHLEQRDECRKSRVCGVVIIYDKVLSYQNDESGKLQVRSGMLDDVLGRVTRATGEMKGRD